MRGLLRKKRTSLVDLLAVPQADESDLQKNPVDGFSAGLVDDDNILEWQIVIMGWVLA